MAELIDDTLDRKLTYLKYENDRLHYKMDESLYYLLQKIQEVDKGPDPVAYLYSLQMPNLVDEGNQAHTTTNLFAEEEKARLEAEKLPNRHRTTTTTITKSLTEDDIKKKTHKWINDEDKIKIFWKDVQFLFKKIWN